MSIFSESSSVQNPGLESSFYHSPPFHERNYRFRTLEKTKGTLYLLPDPSMMTTCQSDDNNMLKVQSNPVQNPEFSHRFYHFTLDVIQVLDGRNYFQSC